MLPSYSIDRPSCQAKSAGRDQYPYHSRNQQGIPGDLYQLQPQTSDVYGLQHININPGHFRSHRTSFFPSASGDSGLFGETAPHHRHQQQIYTHLDFINPGYNYCSEVNLHHPRSYIHQSTLGVWPPRSIYNETPALSRAMDGSIPRSDEQMSSDGRIISTSSPHKRVHNEQQMENVGDMSYKRPRVSTLVQNIPLPPENIDTADQRRGRRGGEYEVLDLSVRCSPPESHHPDYYAAAAAAIHKLDLDPPMHGYSGTPVYSYRSSQSSSSSQPVIPDQTYQPATHRVSSQSVRSPIAPEPEYRQTHQQHQPTNNTGSPGNQRSDAKPADSKVNTDDAAMYLTKELEDIDFTTMKTTESSSTVSTEPLTREEDVNRETPAETSEEIRETEKQENEQETAADSGEINETQTDEKLSVETERDKCNTPLIDERDEDNATSGLAEINNERCDTPCLDEMTYVEQNLQLATPPCEEVPASPVSDQQPVTNVSNDDAVETISENQLQDADNRENEKQYNDMIPVTVLEETVSEEEVQTTSTSLDEDDVPRSSASSLEVEAACNALIDHLQNEPSHFEEIVENVVTDDIPVLEVGEVKVEEAIEVAEVKVEEAMEVAEYEVPLDTNKTHEESTEVISTVLCTYPDTSGHTSREHTKPPELLMVDPRLLIEVESPVTIMVRSTEVITHDVASEALEQRDVCDVSQTGNVEVTTSVEEVTAVAEVGVKPIDDTNSDDAAQKVHQETEVRLTDVPTVEMKVSVESIQENSESSMDKSPIIESSTDNDVDVTERNIADDSQMTETNDHDLSSNKDVNELRPNDDEKSTDDTEPLPSESETTPRLDDKADDISVASERETADTEQSPSDQQDVIQPSAVSAVVENAMDTSEAPDLKCSPQPSQSNDATTLQTDKEDLGSLPIVQLAMKSAEEFTQMDAEKQKSLEAARASVETISDDSGSNVVPEDVCVSEAMHELCSDDQPPDITPDQPENFCDTPPEELAPIDNLQKPSTSEQSAPSVEQNVDPPTLDFIALSEAFGLPTQSDVTSRVSPDDSGPPSLIPIKEVDENSAIETNDADADIGNTEMETGDDDEFGPSAIILDYNTWCQLHPNKDTAAAEEEETPTNSFASDLIAAYDGADIDQLKDARTHEALSALDRLSEQLAARETVLAAEGIGKTRKPRRKRRKSPYTKKPRYPPQPRVGPKRKVNKKSGLERLHQELNMDLVFYAHENSEDEEVEEPQNEPQNEPENEETIDESTYKAAESHQHSGGRHTRRSCELCKVKRRIMHGSFKRLIKRDYSEKSPTKTSPKPENKTEETAVVPLSVEVGDEQVEPENDTTPVKSCKINVNDLSPVMNGKNTVNIDDLPLTVSKKTFVKRKRGRRSKKKVTFSLTEAAESPAAPSMPSKDKITTGIARFKEKIKGLKPKSLQKPKSGDKKKKVEKVDVAVGPDEPMTYLPPKHTQQIYSSRGYKVKSKGRSKRRRTKENLCWFDYDERVHKRLLKRVDPTLAEGTPPHIEITPDLYLDDIEPHSSNQERSTYNQKSRAGGKHKHSRDRPTVGSSPTSTDRSMDVFTFRDDEIITNAFPSPPHSPTQQQTRENRAARDDVSDNLPRPTRLLQPKKKRRVIEAAAGAPVSRDIETDEIHEDPVIMSDEARTALTAAVLDIRPAHRAQIKRQFKFRERLTYSKYKKDSKIHSHQEERVMRLKKQLQSQMINLNRIKVREDKRRIPKSVKHLLSQEDDENDDDDDDDDYEDDVGSYEYDDNVHLGSIDEDAEAIHDNLAKQETDDETDDENDDEIEDENGTRATVDDLVEFEECPPEEGVDDRVAAEHALKFRRKRDKPVKQYDIKLFEPI